ncbi:MAG: formylglycine-generating enzyme family protein [Deltaproteobacteria bacterium]|jgi:formylglycine-generating enzyme required for sulfatase activity|nr:formylglycine-generating enzyme family protein [Deltaproteobacteria bacterium]
MTVPKILRLTFVALGLILYLSFGSGMAEDNTSSDSHKQRRPIDKLTRGKKTYTNSIGMEFIFIPDGVFRMGAIKIFENAFPDELPRHQVTLSKPFYIGKYEVRQKEWFQIMGSYPDGLPAQGDNYPIVFVSWNDAQEFINRLNQKEGHSRYRLPTEAEWEYMARAGTETAYTFGNDPGKMKDPGELGDHAWFIFNSDERLHPVGQKLPNPWGIYDVPGSVSEWVEDWYDQNYYSISPTTDPPGPSSGTERCIRGGGYMNHPRLIRSASRSDARPKYVDRSLGFRLVLSTN